MADSVPSSQTLLGSSPPPASSAAKLDLSSLPPVFVSSTHLDTDDLHEIEEDLVNTGAILSYDINEAKIVLSRVTRRARIRFDLRSKGLWTEEYTSNVPVSLGSPDVDESPKKRRKLDRAEEAEKAGEDGHHAIVIDDSSTASEAEEDSREKIKSGTKRPISSRSRDGPVRPVRRNSTPPSSPPPEDPPDDLVRVLKIEWFFNSRSVGYALPFDDYLSYQGKRVNRPIEAEIPEPTKTTILPKAKPTISSQAAVAYRPQISAQILERAKADAPKTGLTTYRHHGPRKLGQIGSASRGATFEHGKNSQYSHLLHQTTSEDENGISSDLPEMPEWVKQGVKYACQRATPKTNPNDPFLAQLKKIKLARLLTNDEIGVRAYSTSIASLAAYPHKISNPREILAIPGCDAKIANLYVEYTNTSKIQAAVDAEDNEDLKILRLFYDIWGVGATTAREFYYDRGWRELDDIVEFGWSTLSRVQQIGVKYYDEFLDPIPRAEVEQIAQIVHRHAVKVRDEGVQHLIVGGYRRGKDACGDVDMIVSHPNEGQTLNIVNDIVASLEEEGWVTHTLLLSLNSTNRGQQTLPFRTGGGGHGFDTLDKALVVWQDPTWLTMDEDLQANPKAKNPNIHRRVDIIVSPWRTVGCAVTGWSGGTTFQRDLRRFAKNVKGWKFDSSGVRDRAHGQVVDLEGWSKGEAGRAKTMLEAERRVFEGMGLIYREPWDRCTG